VTTSPPLFKTWIYFAKKEINSKRKINTEVNLLGSTAAIIVSTKAWPNSSVPKKNISHMLPVTSTICSKLAQALSMIVQLETGGSGADWVTRKYVEL